jgi:hypothetical protein
MINAKIPFKKSFLFLTKSGERIAALVFFIAIFSYFTIRGDSDTPINQLAGYYLGTGFENYPELMSQLKSADGLIPLNSEMNKDMHYFVIKSDQRKPKIEIYAGGKTHQIHQIKLTFYFDSESICETAFDTYEGKLDDKYVILTPGVTNRYSHKRQFLDIDSECEERGRYFTIRAYDSYLSKIALNYKNGFDTLEVDSVLNERRYGSDFIPLSITETPTVNAPAEDISKPI